MDFVFTGDSRLRILLEVKKLSNGKFWNGLHVQTPIYLQSKKVQDAIFLAIRDSATEIMRKRWKSLADEAQVVRDETGFRIEIARVDAMPKESASKATSRHDQD